MSNTFGKMMLIYNEVGGKLIPSFTIEAPWPDGTVELYESKEIPFLITDTCNISTIWLNKDGNSVHIHSKENGPWIIENIVLTTNETFVISNLPNGSIVSIGENSYTVTDGIFEFESETAGSYTYSVECWPYYSTNGTVVFQ